MKNARFFGETCEILLLVLLDLCAIKEEVGRSSQLLEKLVTFGFFITPDRPPVRARRSKEE